MVTIKRRNCFFGALALTCFLGSLFWGSNPAFASNSPNKGICSREDFRFGLIDSSSNDCTMKKVLTDFGISPDKIRDIDLRSKNLDLNGIDVLVLADGAVNNQAQVWENTSKIEKIQQFVKGGGICWITSQDDKTWTSDWLPDSLSESVLKHQYRLRCDGHRAPHYVSPWLIKRHHPVFNHPNYLDESNFSFWAPTVDDAPCFTAGFSALTRAQGWDVLGRYSDPSVDEGALILQAPDGDGVYFWTQIFSPQIIWNQSNKRYRQTWEKFLENILTYFVALNRNENYQIQSQPQPWSVIAGESLAIKTTVESSMKVKQVNAEVRSPNGRLIKMKLSSVKDGWSGKFIPGDRGEYSVRIMVDFDNGAKGYDHFFFKVTKGWTPYRFISHIHMRDVEGWATQDGGALFGGARYLGHDVVLLACLSEKVWERNEPFIVDNPACRFVPGEELHYRIYKRSGEKSEHYGRDIRAVNIPHYIKYEKVYEDTMYKQVAEYIDQIHALGGFVVANDLFWNHSGLKVNATYQFSRAFEFWEKGEKVWTWAFIDCHGIITLLARGDWNIIWLDKPLTIPNFMEALEAGRFVPASKIDSVWVDIGGQPMGGTVYAAGKVPLHFRIDAGEPVKGIGTIRWPAKPGTHWRLDKYKQGEEYVIPPEGPRKIQEVKLIKNGNVFKTITPQTKMVEKTIEDYVSENSFYCLDIRSNDGWARTNPIFVKHIQGPSSAWLWTGGEVEKVKYDEQNKKWTVALSKAGGDLHFALPGVSSVKIDGKEIQFQYDSTTDAGKISVPAGRHKVEFFHKQI